MAEVIVEAGRPTTYEEIVDGIVAALRRRGWLDPGPVTPWDGFERLSSLVHSRFVIPATSYSPVMRRLVFALACARRPRTTVGIGTYVGYTLAWLIGDRNDRKVGHLCQLAVGIEIDAGATAQARTNCSFLGHGASLTLEATDGVHALKQSRAPIDLLYLDLDSPSSGKAGYRDAIEAARPRLRTGSLVLAHDPLVPKFSRDFAGYDEALRADRRVEGPLVLSVDACGLSVASVRRTPPASSQD